MQAYVDQGGVVTIPQHIQDRIGLKPGDKIDFSLDSSGRVTIEKVDDLGVLKAESTGLDPNRFEKLRGTLKSDMTTDEIMIWLRGEPD